MCKICWTFIVILSVISGVLTYKFILSGDVVESSDGRLAIQLTSNERDLVLTEMRTFLESVQQITQGISSKDFTSTAEAARRVGRAAQQDMPGSLVGKLPLEFKKTGFDTHSKFTQLALDAEQLSDTEHSLAQLSELLQNCVSCHASYKFEVIEN